MRVRYKYKTRWHGLAVDPRPYWDRPWHGTDPERARAWNKTVGPGTNQRLDPAKRGEVSTMLRKEATMANNHHNRTSILIVDDHEVVRKGIRGYLETVKEFQVIGEAASGEDAIKLVSEHIPDIVLLDLIMPGMDGVETTRRIKQISPRTQVVVLTSYHEDVHIFPALKAGAISYILKDMKMEKLVDVLHRAAQKEVTLHPLVAARVLQNLRSDNGDEQPLFTELTERELDVLRLIAKGMTNSQIAEKLVISEYTVKGHVSNILSKLHLADRTQVAVYAWQRGLVNREQMGKK